MARARLGVYLSAGFTARAVSGHLRIALGHQDVVDHLMVVQPHVTQHPPVGVSSSHPAIGFYVGASSRIGHDDFLTNLLPRSGALRTAEPYRVVVAVQGQWPNDEEDSHGLAPTLPIHPTADKGLNPPEGYSGLGVKLQMLPPG